MKYTVKMSCGHEEQVELFGSSAEREKKIIYYQECGVCEDCRRQQVEDNLTGFLKIDDLPDLHGSEKQIKWAEDIRRKAVAEINGSIKILSQPEAIAAYEEAGRQVKKVFDNITDAGRIIDIREKLSAESIKYLVKQIMDKSR